MNWAETVTGHTAWAVHASTLALAEANEWPDDENSREAVDRARWVLRDVWARFEAMDARQVATATLDALQSHFSQARDTLANLQGNGAYAASLHTTCDAIVSTTGAWQRPPAEVDLKILHQTARGFSADIEKTLKAFAQTIATAAAETDRTKTEFAATAATMKADLTALSERVERQAKRLDDAIDLLSTRYEDAETARSTSADEAAAQRVKAFEDERQRVTGLTDEHLSSLAKMLGEARNTLQAIGVTTTASHYGSYARRQSRAGLLWATIAVLLGVGGAGVTLWVLHSVSSGGQSWQVLSLKSLTTTIGLAVAGYAASQSAGHRREERRARRMELGLAALDPFLANVDGDDVKTLRLALGAELFAAPAKEQDHGFSPLASLQQTLTQKAVTGRLEVAAGLKDGGHS